MSKARKNVSKLNATFVNVREYGAAVDGVTLDTGAIQSAIDAQNAKGGGDVLIPNGTCLSGALNLKTGVRLVGQSKAAILKASIGTATAFISIDGQSDAGVERLTIDMNAMPGNDGNGAVAVVHKTTSAAADSMAIAGCKFQGGVIRPYYNNVCSIASRGVRIEGNEFVGKSTLTIGPVAPNARATQALRFLSATGCGSWHILNNRSKYCGAFIQIRHESVQAFDRFDSVVVSGNTSTDILDDSNVSSSPYELFCVTGLTVTGNTIRSGGRGFNATYCKGAVYSANVAYDQTLYFLEMQSCDGVSIVGNSAYNCRSLVSDTSTGIPGSKNIVIHDNNVDGGSDGEVGYNYQTFLHAITMVAGTSGYRNWSVKGNTFSGMKWLDAGIRIDGADLDGYVCEDNVFIQSEESCRPRAVNYVKGSNVSIKRNRVIHSANVTDVTINSAQIFAFISVSTGGGGAHIEVEENTVRWTGSDTRTAGNNTGVIGIGANVAAAALANVTVKRNRLVGAFANPFYLQNTSGDTVLEDNDLSQATGTLLLNAAIVQRRTKRQIESTAAPVAGTWAVGEICWNSTTSTLSTVAGWMCQAAGTPGTWVPFALLNLGTSVTGATDADVTLTPGNSRATQVCAAPLTANRTMTLSTTNAFNGSTFRVTRTAASTGAFTLSVGGLKLLATGQWCDVVYNGSAWLLVAFGTL
jgi:hypothetical protein